MEKKYAKRAKGYFIWLNGVSGYLNCIIWLEGRFYAKRSELNESINLSEIPFFIKMKARLSAFQAKDWARCEKIVSELKIKQAVYLSRQKDSETEKLSKAENVGQESLKSSRIERAMMVSFGEKTLKQEQLKIEQAEICEIIQQVETITEERCLKALAMIKTKHTSFLNGMLSVNKFPVEFLEETTSKEAKNIYDRLKKEDAQNANF